jgi:hypothetical protein
MSSCLPILMKDKIETAETMRGRPDRSNVMHRNAPRWWPFAGGGRHASLELNGLMAKS